MYTPTLHTYVYIHKHTHPRANTHTHITWTPNTHISPETGTQPRNNRSTFPTFPPGNRTYSAGVLRLPQSCLVPTPYCADPLPATPRSHSYSSAQASRTGACCLRYDWCVCTAHMHRPPSPQTPWVGCIGLLGPRREGPDSGHDCQRV